MLSYKQLSMNLCQINICTFKWVSIINIETGGYMVAKQIYQELSVKQEELSARIEAITNDFQKGRSADFAEQTTESENDEVLAVIRDEAKEELKQITRALKRIENEEFGLCIKCGDTIADARLKALPYTDYCINCAN